MIDSVAYRSMLLRNQFVNYCNRALQEIGLSQGQLFFILYIGKHTCCTPSNLSETLKLDTGHATRTIAKLIKNGFVIQETSKQDRRVHFLSLSEKGLQAYTLSHTLFTKWDDEMLKMLSEKEVQQLKDILDRITNQKECNHDI